MQPTLDSPISQSPSPKPPTPSEITFTRGRHAIYSLILATGFLLATIVILVLGTNRVLYNLQMTDPPSLWWSLAPLPFAIALAWLGWQQLRNPFLVVSRLGLEIHPLLPSETIDHITWVEVQAAATDPGQTLLTLTLNTDDQSKIQITLNPIVRSSRPLLIKVLNGIMDYRAKQIGQN